MSARTSTAERRALIALGTLVALAVAGPWVWRASPVTLDLSQIAAPPSALHPLGTDESGRDVLSRLLYGGRVSLLVGLLSMLVATSFGFLVGALAGFRAGVWEALLMRLTDAALAIPAIFIAICLLTFHGSTIPVLVLALASTTWMPTARVVRAEVARVRPLAFVEAARALGLRRWPILWRHIVPHVVPTLLVSATVAVATAILGESALSFLGLGVQPPTPSWGNMLGAAQASLSTAPWLAVAPGLMLLALVASVSMLGEALRRRGGPDLEDKRSSAALHPPSVP